VHGAGWGQREGRLWLEAGAILVPQAGADAAPGRRPLRASENRVRQPAAFRAPVALPKIRGTVPRIFGSGCVVVA